MPFSLIPTSANAPATNNDIIRTIQNTFLGPQRAVNADRDNEKSLKQDQPDSKNPMHCVSPRKGDMMNKTSRLFKMAVFSVILLWVFSTGHISFAQKTHHYKPKKFYYHLQNNYKHYLKINKNEKNIKINTCNCSGICRIYKL